MAGGVSADAWNLSSGFTKADCLEKNFVLQTGWCGLDMNL
jgi:hypothetical protein